MFQAGFAMLSELLSHGLLNDCYLIMSSTCSVITVRNRADLPAESQIASAEMSSAPISSSRETAVNRQTILAEKPHRGPQMQPYRWHRDIPRLKALHMPWNALQTTDGQRAKQGPGPGAAAQKRPK